MLETLPFRHSTLKRSFGGVLQGLYREYRGNGQENRSYYLGFRVEWSGLRA